MKNTTVTFVQPAVPTYRVPFFDELFSRLNGQLSVFASVTSMEGLGKAAKGKEWLIPLKPLLNFPIGLVFQRGLLFHDLGKPDLVVLCGDIRNLSTLFLLVRLKVIGIPVVWWGHLKSSKSSGLRTALRLTFGICSNKFLFYTESECMRFRNFAFFRSLDYRRSGFLGNGLALSEIEKLRDEFRWRERKGNIVFVGRLTRMERLEIILEALASLDFEFYILHVIGCGPAESRLQKKARDLGIDHCCIWYGGITAEAKIAEIMNRCEAFVFGGAVGLSIIHAMAYGLPVVVHSDRNRHSPEIEAFQEGRTGFGYEKGNFRSLQDVLIRLRGETELLADLSRECISSVEKSYTTGRMADRFLSLVREFTPEIVEWHFDSFV